MEHNDIVPPNDNQSSLDLVIRYANLDDLDRIRHIAFITWDDTYNKTIDAENRRQFLEQAYRPEMIAEAVDAPGHWLYVIDYQGDAVGFGHFLKRYHPRQQRAELVRLYVLPGYQKVGRGEALLRCGFSDLAQAKVDQCFVSVQESNILARKFYERHGFTYQRNHGQFLGTQIITLAEYTRPITPKDITL